MSAHRLMQASLAAVTVAALAACATDPIAPRSAALPGDAALVTTTATPAEGVVQICKSGNASGSFDFEWTTTRYSDGAVTGPTTTSVAVGSCVTIINGLSARYSITITEKAPLPADWAFTSLTWDYDARGPVFPSVTGQSITANISNDRGLTAYFTNTYTPPPPPPSCTRTQGYWKTHQELWDTSGERVVWNGETFFNSGKTYAEIFAMSARGGNSYIQLAHQYMAAKLNLNGGSDPDIDAAIAQAEALLAGHTAGSYYIKDATWTSLAGTLDDYNNGVTGPGHCTG